MLTSCDITYFLTKTQLFESLVIPIAFSRNPSLKFHLQWHLSLEQPWVEQ
jgi:hypothetical protein